MEITTSSNKVTITGNIKSVSDYQSIKSELDHLAKQYSSITVDIKDSISITSSVIGYFNKLVLKDNIDLRLNIGNDQLLDLLKDLNLASTFKATKA
ncbi:hypothetical protein MNB_SM-3-1238 [hydrothermal vent metagenome]|uniref:STAS domain-containing protein n=1 Tax=hydrothermal vent metagenome TaxID=652676 RepID=A0A1W1D3E3_9ZZZZ